MERGSDVDADQNRGITDDGRGPAEVSTTIELVPMVMFMVVGRAMSYIVSRSSPGGAAPKEGTFYCCVTVTVNVPL
jgi:hypothetical protein